VVVVIITGMATVLIPTKTQDDEAVWIEDYSNPTRLNVPANFQNKPSQGIQFSAYGINESANPKYVFVEGNCPEIKEGLEIINDETGKVYEIKKIFDGYTDHMELIAVPVTGGSHET
jgi:hypothetical protein